MPEEKQGDCCALSTWRNCAILIYLGHMISIPVAAAIEMTGIAALRACTDML